MQQKPLVYSFLFLVLALMLTSCGSSNKFASSFGKRKYMKGYFVDLPSAPKEPAYRASLLKLQYRLAGNIVATPQLSNTLKTNPVNSHISTRSNYMFSSKKSIKVQSPSRSMNIFLTTGSKVITTSPTPNETNFADAKSDINYWAIIGCALSIAGVILTAINGSFTIAAIIVLVLAAGFCVYSFFVDKYSLTWMAALGLILIILLFALILL